MIATAFATGKRAAGRYVYRLLRGTRREGSANFYSKREVGRSPKTNRASPSTLWSHHCQDAVATHLPDLLGKIPSILTLFELQELDRKTSA